MQVAREGSAPDAYNPDKETDGIDSRKRARRIRAAG
jgi:hypothetical protein